MNQNLKQLGKQLLDIWKQLGLNQRLSVALAGAAVLIGLGALTFFSSRVSYATLFTGLDPADAAKAVSELEKEKVPYRMGAGGTSIEVPRDEVDKYRMKLAPNIRTGELPSWDDFMNSNPQLQSDFAQKMNYGRVRDAGLARAIMTMDGVEKAWVQVVEPGTGLLRYADEHASASVALVSRGGRTISRETVEAIQALVANAVRGLKRNAVAVTDSLGNLLSEEDDGDGPGSKAGGRFRLQQQVEAHYAKQVRNMLDAVLGPGASHTVLKIDLDMDTITSTERTLDAAGKVPKSLTETEEVTTSTTGGGGAAPGIGVNSASATNVVASTAPVNNNNTTTKKTETLNDFGEIMRRIEQQAGSVKRISAAVVVNTRYEGAGADRKALPRTPEELDKLKGLVRTALGLQTETEGTRKDDIVLEELAFNETPRFELNAKLEEGHKYHFWLTLAQRLAYPALALFIVFMLVRAFRNTSVEDIPVGVPVGELDENGQLSGDWNGNGKPRVVTIEVLNQLVKENPRNVTHALRAWMNGAPTKNN